MARPLLVMVVLIALLVVTVVMTMLEVAGTVMKAVVVVIIVLMVSLLLLDSTTGVSQRRAVVIGLVSTVIIISMRLVGTEVISSVNSDTNGDKRDRDSGDSSGFNSDVIDVDKIGGVVGDRSVVGGATDGGRGIAWGFRREEHDHLEEVKEKVRFPHYR